MSSPGLDAPGGSDGLGRVAVLGVSAGGIGALPAGSRRLIDEADLVVGPAAWLAEAGVASGRWLEMSGDLDSVVTRVGAEVSDERRVCVLASGDPGFFGIVRFLAARLGPGSLDVRPAPSSVSLAFARLGLPWDDALVVSAHGRPLEEAVRAVVDSGATKAAVLTSPDAPPETVAKALIDAGANHDRAVVATHLGSSSERLVSGSLASVADGIHDPRSVLVLLRGDGIAGHATLAWSAGGAEARPGAISFGRSRDEFDHRGAMVTSAEVRAVVLAKLELPESGLLWDVGAGSGSVGIEAAALSPGLQVVAIERRPDDAGRIVANAARHEVAKQVRVLIAEAPAALAQLPDPDRAFVGGGGLEVLDAVLLRVRPGGATVATFAALDRAAAAASRLGNLVEVRADRGVWLPDGGLRLEASNPVFVVWGRSR